MTLRTLNYGIYGIFLIMGNAGFCPSAVVRAPSGSGSCSGPRHAVAVDLGGKEVVSHLGFGGFFYVIPYYVCGFGGFLILP